MVTSLYTFVLYSCQFKWVSRGQIILHQGLVLVPPYRLRVIA